MASKKGKNVLVISSSMRKKSNSLALSEYFAFGAASKGNNVELISLRGKKMKYCVGCMGCEKNHKCFIKDDASKIVDKMMKVDVLVFATPIYYYEMSGQLKTLLDRANPLYGSKYKFKKVYALATATEDKNTTPKNAFEGIKGWVKCFPRARFVSSLFIGDVTKEGDIEGNKRLASAFKLGMTV